jgi:Putative metal-binding motif
MIANRGLRTIIWAMLLCSCGDDPACRTPGAVRIGGVCKCPKDTTFLAVKGDDGECVSNSDPTGMKEVDARVLSGDDASADAPSPRDADLDEGPTKDTSVAEAVGDAGENPERGDDASAQHDPEEDSSTSPQPVVDASNQGTSKPDAAAGKADAAVEPPACVPETEKCDGADNDCDDRADEGVLNACKKCGPVPVEDCDGADNDCDGKTDEGLLNACNKCGTVPADVCDGVDNDCDGKTDEGLLNACNKCGTVPADVCDGADNDCDGITDNALTAVCPLGQACTAGKCQPLCGNGKKDAGEACDPTAPGGTVFSCSPSCAPQNIFAPCTPTEVSGPGDCGEGFVCGGLANEGHFGAAFCTPLEPCPEIAGVDWELYGNRCVLPCSNSSQCPLAVSYCYPNPLGGTPTAWCVK